MLKKLSILGTLSVAFALFTSTAFAAPLHLGSKGQLNAKACGKEGNVIINVNEKVENDADSGFAGYWAFDTYMRNIKVWQTDDSTWCAVVTYNGDFKAVAGQTGPGGTGTIGQDVEGDMHGGYRATFTGTLLQNPLWPTHGFVGTVDYKCDLTGNCPGAIDWLHQYFGTSADSSFAQPWWGWIYHADDRHGTWLNQIDVPAASSGNIL